MSKVFFISDTHLGHLNILKYEPIRLNFIWERYYKNQLSLEEFKKNTLALYEDESNEAKEKLIFILKQHDELIISNWNNTVGKNDLVWFLGDFCMGSRNKIKEYKSKLYGHIRMIKGNHDNVPNCVYLEAGFKSVSDYPVVIKQKFILSHAPIESMFISKNDQFFNIFGHVHSNSNIETETANQLCVCIERTNFKPIRFDFFEKFNTENFFKDQNNRHNDKIL